MEQNAKEKVIEYKILLIGDSDSNKTPIFYKIIYGKSYKPTLSTIGVDFESKNFIYKNKKYSIKLFDIAGQERFRSIRKAYWHMGNGFFVVFNLSNEQSLYSIKEWIDSIEKEIQNPKIVILGHETQSNYNIPDDIINQYLKNYSKYTIISLIYYFYLDSKNKIY